MMTDTTENNFSNDVKIDEAKLNRMKIKIYGLEHSEIMTHEKSKSDMIDSIKKIIEQEAKKCN